MPLWLGIFLFGFFLSIALNESWDVFASRFSSSSSNFFPSYSFILHFFYVLSFSIFYSKILSFFCFWLMICLCTHSTNLLVEFSFVILEYPVLFVLMYSVQVSFDLFLPVVLTDLSVVVFLEIFSYFLVPLCFTFLRSFACCVSFCICPSCLISHPAFVFLFRVLRGYLFFTD